MAFDLWTHGIEGSYRLGKYTDVFAHAVADSTMSVSDHVPAGCAGGLVQVTNPVRMRVDTTDPTSTVGYIIQKDQDYFLDYDTLKAAVFIRDGSTSATMNILFVDRE